MTSLSKLLLNELSPLQIVEQASEIVRRDAIISGEELGESSEDEILERKKSRVPNISDEELGESSEDEVIERKKTKEKSGENSEYQIVERQKVEANYHVSEFCSICRASKNQQTPPILAEILFENRTVQFPVKFSVCGDGLELVELAGVTNGYCYKCELQSIDPKLERGQTFGTQPILSNGETLHKIKPRLRTLERANKFSKIFNQSETKNITKRRKESLQYERTPKYQYDKSLEEVDDPDFHTASNIATRRVYLRGLEYCKLIDAHLLENEIVQENQRLAFQNLKKTLPAFEAQNLKLKTATSEYKVKIKKLEQSIEKASEKLKKKKSGKLTETARKAKKRRIKIRKKLREAKRNLTKENLKHENSRAVQKFKKARTEILKIAVPKEIEFTKLGFVSSKKKGCSLDGRETYNLLKSQKVMDLIFERRSYGKITVGDPALLKLATEYSRLRYKELNLTCNQRSFCHHEIGKIEIFNGAASRLESQVYSDQIMLMSTHFREHLIESLKRKKELIARDSLTEYLNQRALKIENKTKFARSFNERAVQMSQHRHTEATAPDFTARKRTRYRAETSTVFPDSEEKKK